MIAKKVLNPKKSSSKAVRARGLVSYITEPERENGLEKCIHFEAENFVCEDLQSQVSEMIALSSESVRSKDPIDHWVLSWRPNEQPSVLQVRQAVAIFINQVGLEGHQTVWGMHDDTQSMHVHIAVNRVHPDTLKVIKINKFFGYEDAHKAIALIEHRQGWTPAAGAHYKIENGKPVLKEKQMSVDKAREPKSKVKDMEVQTGTKSIQRIGIEEAAPIIKAAKSWAELHIAMQAAGMSYERKGSGAVIYVGEVTLKASDVDRAASIGALQKRLGPYQPPQEINTNDYHHHATHTVRSSTGAIVTTQKSHALAAGKDAGYGLRPLSQCGLAHSEKSKSASRPRVLLIDARADRRATGGLRRPTGRDAEPLKQNQSGWDEYQKIKAERSASKSAELLVLRMQHDKDKDKLHAKHVAERADLLKGNWQGKGDVKNAFSSVIATQQAAEKMALRERHKDEREALNARYQPMPQYKAWQQQPRFVVPVAAMAHTSKQPERLSNVVLALTHTQDKRGVAYLDKGRELFIDQGRNLSIVKYGEQTSKQIAAALAVAQHKFGITLTVTGPDEFKTRAVAAAVEFELIVKFSDPAMETHRLQMTEAKRQAERESKRLALEAAREAQSQAAKVSLLESKEACVLWINGESGQHVPVDPQQSDYVGPVVQLDGLHAVQKVGRTAYAIHELENLDSVPAVGDTKTEIQYRGGVGYVKGSEINGQER